MALNMVPLVGPLNAYLLETGVPYQLLKHLAKVLDYSASWKDESLL